MERGLVYISCFSRVSILKMCSLDIANEVSPSSAINRMSKRFKRGAGQIVAHPPLFVWKVLAYLRTDRYGSLLKHWVHPGLGGLYLSRKHEIRYECPKEMGLTEM